MTQLISDRVCFILDRDIPDREILAVLSAVQRYKTNALRSIEGWNSTYPEHMRRELSLKMEFVCADEEYAELFLKCVDGLRRMNEQTVLDNVREYDMVRRLSHKNASEFIPTTDAHAAQMYGILIGSEAHALPVIDNWYEHSENPIDVLFVSDSEEQLLEMGNNIELPDGLHTVHKMLTKGLPLLTVARNVAGAKAVVGPLGFATYVAAVLRKALFELYPANMSPFWLAKWSCGSYGVLFCKDANAASQDWKRVSEGLAWVWKKRLDTDAKREVQAMNPVLMGE